MYNILLVENNIEDMKAASIALGKNGHTILDANNAGDCIRLAKELQPDLILLATRLPGMDAFLTTRLLRSNPLTKNIKIIALADDETAERDKLFQVGINEYLRKPFTFENLFSLIEEILNPPKELLRPRM